MSSDHHDAGGGAPENSASIVFMIGVILVLAIIGIGNVPTGTTPRRSTPLIQLPTPAAIQSQPNLSEAGPEYNQSILTAPGPQPPRKKLDPQVASIAPWGYTLTFASKIQVLHKLLEGTSEQRKLTINTVNAGPDGREVEQAAVRLTPVEIQENDMKLITYYQHLTANHVQCYYDEDGGNRHVPDEGVFAPIAIGWSQFRGGAVVNHAVMSTGTLSLDGYNLFETQPDESVTAQNGLDCYTQSEFTDHIGLYKYNDVYEYYKGTDSNQWSADNFCSAGEKAKYDECMAEPCKVNPKTGVCEKPSCSLGCGEGAHTVFSTRLPDADNVNMFSGKGPNDEKEGFTLTQIDSAFDFPQKNGVNSQDHTLQIPICSGCDIVSDTSVYYLEARRRIYIKAFNCSLQPAELADPNDPCPTPPPPPTTTPGTNFGDVCEVASAYDIPCCMLKGLMESETRSGENMGSSSCSTSHGTFKCCHGTACGPAQVLCGQYDGFAGKDKLDMCSLVGGAELLARAMHLKLCQAAGQCQTYDWEKEKSRAMKFKIPSDIHSTNSYTAIGYFYGMNQGCVASACTQYRWGAGKSYCDSVKSYCETGHLLTDNTSMQFCAECNKEIVRAGQAPIQCTQ